MALHVMDEAGRILFENNPLTTVCSLVCNHENQFEYNKAPVEITDEGVIISISQGPQNRIVSTTTGLEANNPSWYFCLRRCGKRRKNRSRSRCPQ